MVARGGSVPGASFAEDLPSPDPFRPTSVNEAEITAHVTELAGGLLPGAVDEAIGHALDNLINSRVDQWRAKVEAEYAEYVGRARFRHQQAVATVEQEIVLRRLVERRLLETELALNSALTRLLGKPERRRARFHRKGRTAVPDTTGKEDGVDG
jgi:hypothetical protein